MHNSGCFGNQKGQGLLEVLVALAIAMLVLSAMAVAAVTSVRNAVFAKNLSQATGLTKQAMDGIRAYRDLNRDASSPYFFSLQNGCYSIDLTNLVDPSTHALNPSSLSVVPTSSGDVGCLRPEDAVPIPGAPFTRTIYLQPRTNPAPSDSTNDCPTLSPFVANQCTEVTVTVYWTDSSGQHQAQEKSIFGKWQ